MSDIDFSRVRAATLPTLPAHEAVELTGPEVTRRAIAVRLGELRRAATAHEETIAASLLHVEREQLALARVRDEAAAWQALAGWADALVDPPPCALCRGEGCTYGCRPAD